MADFAANPASGVAPLTVAFTDQSSGNPTSWRWDFGDGATSTIQNPTHTYAAPGTYTVSLTATNVAGSNTATRTDLVTATPPPAPTADLSASPTSGGAPLDVAFSDRSSGNPTGWSWDFGDGTTSTAQNPLHTYSSPGSYTVSLTIINAGGSDTATKPDYIVAVAVDPVLVGAGDIADCSLPNDEATAALVASIPGTVFTAGDNVYDNGTASEFSDCYDPSWGRFKSRTRPVPGNHEYNTPGRPGTTATSGTRPAIPPRGTTATTTGAGTWSSSTPSVTRSAGAVLAAPKSGGSAATWRPTPPPAPPQSGTSRGSALVPIMETTHGVRCSGRISTTPGRT
jgi:PKD repeat protein